MMSSIVVLLEPYGGLTTSVTLIPSYFLTTRVTVLESCFHSYHDPNTDSIEVSLILSVLYTLYPGHVSRNDWQTRLLGRHKRYADSSSEEERDDNTILCYSCIYLYNSGDRDEKGICGCLDPNFPDAPDKAAIPLHRCSGEYCAVSTSLYIGRLWNAYINIMYTREMTPSY